MLQCNLQPDPVVEYSGVILIEHRGTYAQMTVHMTAVLGIPSLVELKCIGYN